MHLSFLQAILLPRFLLRAFSSAHLANIITTVSLAPVVLIYLTALGEIKPDVAHDGWPFVRLATWLSPLSRIGSVLDDSQSIRSHLVLRNACDTTPFQCFDDLTTSIYLTTSISALVSSFGYLLVGKMFSQDGTFSETAIIFWVMWERYLGVGGKFTGRGSPDKLLCRK